MALTNPVINIFKSLSEAMYFKNSQLNDSFIFSGVQLLPDNPQKYVQVTNTPGGIKLEDWIVKVISVCSGEELGDITDSFLVEQIEINSDNGDPQFIWSLQNIPIDFGWDLIYLQITQSVGETFYTQPFRITSIESEKTAQFSYKFKETDEIQSIGFNAWYDDEDILQEQTSYYEESTQSWVTASMEQGEVEYWRTELMPKYSLKHLKKILGLPFVYINGIRASLKEVPEIPRKTARENFAEMSFTVNFHPNDIFVQKEPSKGDWKASDWKAEDWLIYTE